MNQTPGTSSISALNYMNNQTDFVKGSSQTAAVGETPNNGSQYTMVDMSAWDLSTTCGSCHPGGGFVEKDRNGKRMSMMNPMVDGVTPYTYTVFEKYNSTTGLPEHQLQQAPWSYPMTSNGRPDGQPVIVPGAGWGQGNPDGTPYMITMPDGSQMGMSTGQVMMPNVKEYDCLMCHFQGYNNLMSSVMAYSGAHNATPSFGAGLMNMFTQAYDFNSGLLQKDANGIVSLTPAFFSRMKGNPDTQNCRNCHIPSGLKDLADMFKDFLSSAPMDYKGDYTKSFTGLEMVAFDLNAPFGYSHDLQAGPYYTSPTVYMTQTGLGVSPAGSSPAIPAGWPAAMGMTQHNQETAMSTPGFLGGANPAGSGPMYYDSTMDQNKLKKSSVAFPRAEWFKRGDLWAEGYDVHLKLECDGCHMDTNTAKVDVFVDPMGTTNPNTSFDGKSMCDPGKGYDSAAGVEGNPALRSKTNSQNTVKRCENCHITGKNVNGLAIDTFGAQDPTAAHTAAGLLKNVTQAVGTTNGTDEVAIRGSHMDVLDCTVCHLARKQMIVRLLDSTSGNRYPNMLGYANERGLMGMFSEPGMGIPANTNYKEWEPLYSWQKNGNYFKTNDDGSVNTGWRRKVYGVNIITAAIWTNMDPTIDANGDGVRGNVNTVHAGDYPGSTSANYDTWIARDLKAGLNFGASGFAPIPIGFGAGPFQSAYRPDGSFTGAWQYVGVYGGNAMFSTPEEISGYKAWRNQIKDAVDGKSWDGTKLVLIGGPYKVTHGIRPTSTFVLGKSCTDCHSTNPKGSIFAGDFNMTGTAIKATPGGQFMMSGAEPMKIVAGKEDLETGAELSTKVGYGIEFPFDELGNWDAATKTFTPAANGHFKRTKDLSRSQAMYPIEQVYTDALGRTYPNRAAWINYITNPVAITGTANTLAP